MAGLVLACPGHPRLSCRNAVKTGLARTLDFIGCILKKPKHIRLQTDVPNPIHRLKLALP